MISAFFLDLLVGMEISIEHIIMQSINEYDN